MTVKGGIRVMRCQHYEAGGPMFLNRRRVTRPTLRLPHFATKVKVTHENKINLIKNLTAKQTQTLKAWLGLEIGN